MDVLILPNGINPLDASFPGDAGGDCTYSSCPGECSCNRGSCYEYGHCGLVYV